MQSLHEFEKRSRGETSAMARNLRTLFLVCEVPTDETMRQRPDQVDPALSLVAKAHSMLGDINISKANDTKIRLQEINACTEQNGTRV